MVVENRLERMDLDLFGLMSGSGKKKCGRMDRIPTFDVVDENEGWVGGMLAVIMVELRPTA
tara:strand:- start:25 stop:207 length:183 start_codon:yes stop_codon:yes gene_type:complete